MNSMPSWNLTAPIIFGKRFVPFRRPVFDAAMMEPLLKGRGSRSGVFKSIVLFVNSGEIICLVGSNSVGKTTFLRAISRSLTARGTLASTITGC